MEWVVVLIDDLLGRRIMLTSAIQVKVHLVPNFLEGKADVDPRDFSVTMPPQSDHRLTARLFGS